MTEQKLIKLGKISHFISEIFRYTLILIIFTLVGIGTAGLGFLLGFIFFKFIQKKIPFRTSVYKDYLELTQQKIDVSNLQNRIKRKLGYNVLILAIIASLLFVILWNIQNAEDKIFFLVLFGFMIALVFFQFYYFKSIKDFIAKNTEFYTKEIIIENENIFEKKILNTSSNSFENNVKDSTIKLLHFLKRKNNLSLSHNEVIITSIIIGTITFLILGYSFGEKQYLDDLGERIAKDRYLRYYKNADFSQSISINYILGFTGFIISTGITYLVLNKKR